MELADFIRFGWESLSTPSSDSCAMQDASRPSLELNLPDGEGFRSLPPRVALAEMIQRNRQLRECFPAGLCLLCVLLLNSGAGIDLGKRKRR